MYQATNSNVERRGGCKALRQYDISILLTGVFMYSSVDILLVLLWGRQLIDKLIFYQPILESSTLQASLQDTILHNIQVRACARSGRKSKNLISPSQYITITPRQTGYIRCDCLTLIFCCGAGVRNRTIKFTHKVVIRVACFWPASGVHIQPATPPIKVGLFISNTQAWSRRESRSLLSFVSQH